MFSKIQSLLNSSSRRFWQTRLKDLETERDSLDKQINELIERREAVEEQIVYAEERV